MIERGRGRTNKKDILYSLNLNVEDVLSELRFEFQHSPHYPTNTTALSNGRDSNDWYMACCPNHPERHPSFGVLKEPPYPCNCFYCGYLGTIDEVIETTLGLDSGEGIRWLLSSFIIENNRPTVDVENIIAGGRGRLRIPTLDEQILLNYINADKDHRTYKEAMYYLVKERGLSLKTLKTYEIGVDINNKCITFPMRTRTGGLRFIQKRKIGNYFKGAKFINDGSPVKRDIVFGLHFIDKYKTTEKRMTKVRLCESAIDAMSNYQMGYPAVAINGKILFDNQVRELQLAGVRAVDLMLDNDRAGSEGMKEASEKLIKAGISVRYVNYPNKLKDANELLRAGLLDKCSTSLLRG